jgi:hypothetical protein
MPYRFIFVFLCLACIIPAVAQTPSQKDTSALPAGPAGEPAHETVVPPSQRDTLQAPAAEAQEAVSQEPSQDDSLQTPAAPAEEAVTAEEEYVIDRPEDSAPEGPDTALIGPVRETIHMKSGNEIEKVFSTKIALYSLLLPGLGEYKMGKSKLGKTFMISDGLFWIGLASALYVRALMKDDLRAYLYAYGDCDGNKSVSGRSAWDLTDNELELPLYVDSSADYEERVYKLLRSEIAQEIDFYWQWDSEDHHQVYYNMWKSANRAKVAGYYFLGAAIVLRAASFVNTRQMIKKAGMGNVKQAASSVRIYPYAVPFRESGLRFAYRF